MRLLLESQGSADTQHIPLVANGPNLLRTRTLNVALTSKTREPVTH